MVVRLRLFISSYSPLFLVAAIRFDSTNLRFALLLIALLGALTLLLLIRTSTLRVAAKQVTPSSVRDLGSEVSAYIAAYLLPFIAVNDPAAPDLLAYGVVFVVLAVVFVNSDLIGVNPLLYLLGYRIYSVTGVRRDRYGDEQEAVVISRRPVRAGISVQITDLATGVAIALDPPNGASS